MREVPFSSANLVWLHKTNPLLWIIDSAPIVLGLFARNMGQRAAKIAGSKAALQQSENRLQTIVAAGLDGMIAVDATGNIVIFNAAAERMFGWSASEMIGSPLERLLPPEIRDRHARYVAEYFAHGNDRGVLGRTHELVGCRSDGTTFPMELALSQASSSGNHLVLGIVRDMTLSKQAEDALRSREALLQATLESTADGILVVDAHGKVILSNDRFLQLWRIPQELARQGDDDQLLSFVLDQLESPDVFLNKVRELYGTTREDLDILRFKDGRVFERYSCPLMLENEVTGRVWSFRDITERMESEKQQAELQEQLNKAEKMKSIGILAGGVAHDLNNMLGPLVGYPELVLRKLPDEHPSRRQIERIGRSAKDAADVIQDLLTLARRGRYEMEPTCLNEVIRRFLDSPSATKRLDEQGDVSLAVDLDNNADLIMGSAPHLAKVIMNLFVNALDAMPQGGSLRITTRQQQVHRLPISNYPIEPGEYVVVSAKDTGSGIAEEDVDRIFEPYYSKKHLGASGSGLGLAVVYGIVKDHCGYYDIVTTPGRGTEFRLYFPVTNVTPSIPPPEEVAVGGTESILVVDDVAEQRQLATDILSELGYQVQSVANGHETIEHLRLHRADLIVLDMIMEPDFDGLATYREILRINPEQKAVVASGFSQTDRVTEVLALGAAEYIRKPYASTVLARAVRSALDREAPDLGADRSVRASEPASETVVLS
ncbi:MAG: PAS domain S-box protein [bacterium]